MESKQENQIPCIVCKSYNGKVRKFSCQPHECKELNAWLQKHVPQLIQDSSEIQATFCETSIPYVV